VRSLPRPSSAAGLSTSEAVRHVGVTTIPPASPLVATPWPWDGSVRFETVSPRMFVSVDDWVRGERFVFVTGVLHADQLLLYEWLPCSPQYLDRTRQDGMS
jgi:hypothetical protein